MLREREGQEGNMMDTARIDRKDRQIRTNSEKVL